MTLTKPVSAYLSEWTIPSPFGKENNVTPCYESLIGAGYALFKAEETNYSESSLEDYNVSGFEGCLRLLAKGGTPGDKNWCIWECGFYFLSALHRIVWVHERLIGIFACLPLSEDSQAQLSEIIGRKIGFNVLVKMAQKRIKKLEAFADKYALDGIKNAIQAYMTGSNEEISNSNCLYALRKRGNLQKHAIKGLTFLGPESSVSEDNSLAFKWELLSRDKKLGFALTAFDSVSSLYRDVHRLYFDDKIFRTQNPPPL
jgi:hypothetical protein